MKVLVTVEEILVAVETPLNSEWIMLVVCSLFLVPD